MPAPEPLRFDMTLPNGQPLRFDMGPEYTVERVDSCSEENKPVVANRVWGGGKIFSKAEVAREFTVLSTSDAKALGLERVVASVCYDPSGSEGSEAVKAVGRAEDHK